MRKATALFLATLVLLALCIDLAPCASAQTEEQKPFANLKVEMKRYAIYVIIAGAIGLGISWAWTSMALQGIEDSQEHATVKRRFKLAVMGFLGTIIAYFIILAGVNAIPS